MAVATGSLFDTESLAFEEIINKDVDVILPMLDEAFRGSIVSSADVFPTNQLGREWKAIRIIRGTYTGVIDGGIARGDFTLYGESTTGWGARMTIQDITQTFPDPLEGPKARTVRLAIPLQSQHTNLALSWQEMQAEANPGYVGQVIAPIMEGFARNMAHQLVNFWYISQSNSYRLGTMKGGTVVITEDAPGSGLWRIAFETTELTPNRFWRGMRVDIHRNYSGSNHTRLNDTEKGNADNGASQTVSTRINVLVEFVDELTNTIALVTDVDPYIGWDGMGEETATTSTAAGSQPTTGDFITPANMRTGAGNFTGYAGVNSWIKDGSGGDENFLLGADRDSTDFVSVIDNPEFKSLVGAINGPLTEPLLVSILRRFHSAKDRYGMDVDTLIGSDGVWLEYFRQLIPQFRRDRTGRPASLTSEGLREGFEIVVDGRSYRGMVSTYVEDGVVYGIKKGGGNWERIVPPFPDRAATFDRAEAFIPFRFALPTLLNNNQSRALIFDSSGPNSRSMITEFVQMPGLIHLQYAPKQPVGIKLTGVDTFTYFP